MHGIILQTPLPPGVDVTEVATAIDPAKDVDGANPQSLGRLAAGLPAFPPATAAAVLALLDHHDVVLAGRHAVVLGRSTVVGKPVAHLLLDRDATVTVCHSHPEPRRHWRRADGFAAAGRPVLVTAPRHPGVRRDRRGTTPPTTVMSATSPGGGVSSTA